MKTIHYWLLAAIITVGAAYYQRKTGPTYPKSMEVSINGQPVKLSLTRSISLERPAVIKLAIPDSSVKAKLYFRRFPTKEEFQVADFQYKETPRGNGLFASIPQQPPAGKLQYYFEITDTKGTTLFLEKSPLVVRFKGGVPAVVMIPHILLMFIAMLFSTLAGLLALGKLASFRKYSFWTFGLFFAGGLILGPIVQYYAFGDFWTGVPFGWDLTDNKTLIAGIFWALAVIMNRKKERPLYTILAAIVLLLVYSIPHSMFGSELNYETGSVTQGIITNFFMK